MGPFWHPLPSQYTSQQRPFVTATSLGETRGVRTAPFSDTPALVTWRSSLKGLFLFAEEALEAAKGAGGALSLCRSGDNPSSTT